MNGAFFVLISSCIHGWILLLAKMKRHSASILFLFFILINVLTEKTSFRDKPGQWKLSCDNLNSLASLGVALNHSCWAEHYSFGLLVCFWYRISCNLGWLQTSVTPAFTSRVQGLQVCTSTPCLCGLVDGTPGLYELPNEPRLQLRLKWSCWLTAWPSHPPTLQSAKNCMSWGRFLSQAGKVSSSSAPMPGG